MPLPASTLKQLHTGRGHALDRGDDAGAVDGRVDGVVAGRSGHEQRVVARAAGHDVGAGAAIEHVGAAAGVMSVDAVAADEQVNALRTGDLVGHRRTAEHGPERHAVERKQRMPGGTLTGVSFDTVTFVRSTVSGASNPAAVASKKPGSPGTPGVAAEVSSAVGSTASAQPQPAWPLMVVPLARKFRPSRSM